MTVQPIGGGSAAVYLTAEDLRERGLNSAALTPGEAAGLVREALETAGLSLTGNVEVEVFPGLGGVLAFVRLTAPERRWTVFSTLEDLLAALSRLPREVSGAALYLLEGRYWLALDGEAEGPAAALSEFGDSVPLSPTAEAALLEHAHPLAEGAGLTFFRSCFRV